MRGKLKLVLFMCVVVVLLAGSSVFGTPSLLKSTWGVISARSVLAGSSSLRLAPENTSSALIRIRRGIHPFCLGAIVVFTWRQWNRK